MVFRVPNKIKFNEDKIIIESIIKSIKIRLEMLETLLNERTEEKDNFMNEPSTGFEFASLDASNEVTQASFGD